MAPLAEKHQSEKGEDVGFCDAVRLVPVPAGTVAGLPRANELFS